MPQTGPFRALLKARQPLVGTFVKTPSPHLVEVLGEAGLDFLVVDREHAPFDETAVDLALLAARAQGIATLVRVAEPSQILSALDCGAEGVVVPHVSSPEAARAAVSLCRYAGGRGFSNSPRAGRYGATPLASHVKAQDERVSAIAMIEDPAAVAAAEPILGVEGLDAVFLGCADLAVALGESAPDAPEVRRRVADVCRAADAAKVPVMAMAATVSAGGWLLDLGVTALIVGSDQSLMRQAASAACAEFRDARP